MKNTLQSKADWFIVSKHASDRNDYSILAGSIDANSISDWKSRFANWIKAEVPFGESAYSPGAPWYYFIPEKINDEIMQVIILQKWTDYVDVGGRRVLTTSCLILPFSSFNENPCGFQHMAGFFDQPTVKQYLLEIQERIRNGETCFSKAQISLDLPDPEDIKQYFSDRLENQGMDFANLAANHLIAGEKVCIIDPNNFSDITSRLHLLDSALITLPYGIRADCSVSSWQSNFSGLSDRLVIGHRTPDFWAGINPSDKFTEEQESWNYSKGIQNLIKLGHRQIDIIKSQLSFTQAISLEDLREGKSFAISNDAQTLFFESLKNPKVTRSEDDLRRLVDLLNNVIPAAANKPVMQTLLLQCLPILSTNDEKLNRLFNTYWHKEFDQTLFFLKNSNDNVLQLMPFIIPSDIDDASFRKFLSEVCAFAFEQPLNLKRAEYFFEGFHAFCNQRANIQSSQLNSAIEIVYQVINSRANELENAAFTWIRYVLAPESLYAPHFFDYIKEQPDSAPPLSDFSIFWHNPVQPQTERANAWYYRLPLTKIALKRAEEQDIAFSLLDKEIQECIRLQDPEFSPAVRSELFTTISPYLTRAYWADFPQQVRIAGLLDIFSLVVNQQWKPISTITQNPDSVTNYRRAIEDLRYRYRQYTHLIPHTPIPRALVGEESNHTLLPEESPIISSYESELTETTSESGLETPVDPGISKLESALASSSKPGIPLVARLTAEHIACQRESGSFTLWQDLKSLFVEHKYTFTHSELERFILLTLGYIEDEDLRKESLGLLLQNFYITPGIITDENEKQLFFQKHSELVSEMIRSHTSSFSSETQYREWFLFLQEWVSHLQNKLDKPS